LKSFIWPPVLYAGARCRIYDWRAPVSSIYYEYSLGPASYQGPRRFFAVREPQAQYKIENGKILYLFETESAVHDELLAQCLARTQAGP
jgi:DNA helicase-2/ATP-dependent DNA helicase PcrA